jgi:hypothetical protein
MLPEGLILWGMYISDAFLRDWSQWAERHPAPSATQRHLEEDFRDFGEEGHRLFDVLRPSSIPRLPGPSGVPSATGGRSSRILREHFRPKQKPPPWIPLGLPRLVGEPFRSSFQSPPVCTGSPFVTSPRVTLTHVGGPIVTFPGASPTSARGPFVNASPSGDFPLGSRGPSRSPPTTPRARPSTPDVAPSSEV